MTAETDVGGVLSCRYCGLPQRAADVFCRHCGEPIIPPRSLLPGPPTFAGNRPALNGDRSALNGDRSAHRGASASDFPPESDFPPAQREATTRYLCAAAHLDPEFGDAAIAEFLVEPVRAIPPAPGVDSAAVLRDAVAARARRRLRDAALLALLAMLVYLNWSVLAVWLIVALAVSLSISLNQGISRGRLIGMIFALFGTTWIVLVMAPFRLGMAPRSLDDGLPAGTSSSSGLLTVIVLALAVLAIDEFAVHRLVYTRFRPGQFVPDGRGARSGWERALRTLGHKSFHVALARVAAADEQATQNRDLADVIVHRGFSPFIGAGRQIYRKIIALPLQPAGADEGEPSTNAHGQPRGINVTELQRHVAAAMDELRSSSSLCPSDRLQGLVQREQVLMSADRLVTNRDIPLQSPIFPDLHHPPATHIPTAAARHVADTPQEGARYYRRFRIESWDRDLTTSCYLHVGTDQRMLYLEWTFCILPPIQHGYRQIDRLRHPVLDPLRRSLGELVVLPATALSRFRSVFHRCTPLPQREGEVDPNRYGAGKSLRELAADDDVQTYFQDVDTERYVKILDATLFRAVGHYLEDYGYSVVEFMKQADPVVNQLTISGGTFYSSAVGYGNTTKGTTHRSAAPKGTP